MSEDLTGKRLGHYKIENVLGRGGMSVMYRATDVRLGRKVALKVMGEHITGDGEFRERFVDEARNTSAIDHANIVPLYDFGEVDGMLYIAMRLVDGADIASLVSGGPIAPKRALDLLEQVGEALDMLHEQGLVHLDLKPANVLVTSREASHEHVYLADFGLTRRGATGHRTSSGDFLGSPTYAAPEHLRGDPVDGRTDLYALACMLFTCLTGRPPYQGDVQEIIQGHMHIEAPRVTSLAALPPGVDDVLRRGMAKNPDQRYATCKELVGAAKTALAPVISPAPPMTSPNVASGPQPAAGAYPPGRMPPQMPPAPAAVAPPVAHPAPGSGGPPPPAPPLPPPGNDPVRMPAQPRPVQATAKSAGGAKSSGGARWGVLGLVFFAALVIVVIFAVMVSSVS